MGVPETIWNRLFQSSLHFRCIRTAVYPQTVAVGERRFFHLFVIFNLFMDCELFQLLSPRLS